MPHCAAAGKIAPILTILVDLDLPLCLAPKRVHLSSLHDLLNGLHRPNSLPTQSTDITHPCRLLIIKTVVMATEHEQAEFGDASAVCPPSSVNLPEDGIISPSSTPPADGVREKRRRTTNSLTPCKSKKRKADFSEGRRAKSPRTASLTSPDHSQNISDAPGRNNSVNVDQYAEPVLQDSSEQSYASDA